MNRLRVAVTGIGLVTAVGFDVDTFREALRSGRSGLARVSADVFDSEPAVFAGVVDDGEVARLLSIRGLPTDDALSRPSRMALLALSEALGHSGVMDTGVDPSRIGLVMGKCQGKAMLGDGNREAIEAPLHVVGNCFGLGGPRVMISTACAASTNAIGLARDKLWTGEADVMLAGGTEELSTTTLRGFQAMHAVSPRQCAPYSRSDGLNLGEGAAFLVLEPLEVAEARGAPILAEVLGYGLSGDAHHPTAPDPAGRGATAAMRRALRQAAVDTDEISYVNGHGTGTPANDRMERNVMRALFGARSAHVPVSSTKSLVGHVLGAAGAIEAIACILAIDGDFLPPTLGFEAPDREFDFVPNCARDAKVTIAVSNNYAFGGNNASVVFADPDREAAARPGDHATVPVVITGIGLVGSLGVGVEEWRTVLEDLEGDAALALSGRVGKMPVLNGRDYAAPNEWRHMDALTQQALASTRLALSDAKLSLTKAEREDCALMFGTAFGPAEVGNQLDRHGGGGVSPVAFSKVTINAAAGRISQTLGLRGPTTTFATGVVSGSVAFVAAHELIAAGEVSVAVVIATDELVEGPEASMPATGTHGEFGAAAVAFVLESAERAAARGVDSYCGVLATYQGSAGIDQAETAVPRVVRAALASAGVNGSEVHYAVGCSSAETDIEFEAVELRELLGPDTTVVAPRTITGDCAAASGPIGIAFGALAVRDGREPRRRDVSRPRVEKAVAVDRDLGGATCAVVLGLSA